MQNKKIDGGTLQDLYHYSLAMQGDGGSAFPAETILSRLNALDCAYLILTTLDESEDSTLWEPYMVEAGSIRNESQLQVLGSGLNALVRKVAALLRYDPHSGERIR